MAKKGAERGKIIFNWYFAELRLGKKTLREKAMPLGHKKTYLLLITG